MLYYIVYIFEMAGEVSQLVVASFPEVLWSI